MLMLMYHPMQRARMKNRCDLRFAAALRYHTHQSNPQNSVDWNPGTDSAKTRRVAVISATSCGNYHSSLTPQQKSEGKAIQNFSADPEF